MMKSVNLILLFLFTLNFNSVKANDFAESNTTATADTAHFYTFGGVKTEEFRDLAITSDSGYILVGTTNGYGQGNSSIYVVRTDKKGSHIWSTTLGGSNIDRGAAVLVLEDGDFLIAGSSNSYSSGGYNGYLARIDDLGNLVWEKTIGGNDWDFFYDMSMLSDSSIILCGESYSYSSGGSDAWVVRVDLYGNILWQNNYGSNGNDDFRGITSKGESIYLCGHYQGTSQDGYLVKIDIAANLIFEKQFSLFGNDRFNAITQGNNSELILVGGSIHTDSINSEFWLQEIDTNGVAGFEIHGISEEDDYMNSVIVKSNSDIIATGMKNPSGFGKKSMFTFSYDVSAANFSAQTFGGNEDDEAFRVIETMDEGLAFAGSTNSYGSGDLDACLLLLDTNTIFIQITYTPHEFLETLSPIGIEEGIENRISTNFFPNPAHDFIVIRSSEQLINIDLFLTNLDGKVLKQFDGMTITDTKLDISFLPVGVYILEMKNKEGLKLFEKIIKI